MKFSINSTALGKALAVLCKVIPSKPIMAAYEWLHFEVKDGTLTVKATDGDIIARCPLHISADSEEGVACLPANVLSGFLSNMPDTELAFDTEGRENAVTVGWDSGKAQLPLLFGQEWPAYKEMEEDEVVSADAKTLGKAIALAAGSAGDDPLRPTLSGLSLRFSADGIEVCGTDAKEVVVATVAGSFPDGQVIVPKKLCGLLKTIFAAGIDSVDMRTDGQRMEVSVDGFTICGDLIQGKFPDYRSVLPKEEGASTLVAETAALRSALRTVAAVVKGTHVKFDISSEGVKIEAQDIAFNSSARQSLPCSYSGEDICIGFSADKLLGIVSRFGSEETVVKMHNPRQAVLITPEKQEENLSVLAVLMPVFIQ